MSRPRRRRALAAVAVVLCIVPALSSAQSVPSPAADRSTAVPVHAGHATVQTEPQPAAAPHQDHSAHEQGADTKPYPPDIPPVTEEDRKAAFPDLNGQHTVHDDAIHYYVLIDQLEWQAGTGAAGLNWNNKGWIGRDVNRFWFRTEGEAEAARLGSAQAHALYGRAIHRWWDLVGGVRQDIDPGPAQTWAAVGIQGLAPYWFEIEATAYVGASGRTHFRFATEYELLLTNRLILQPSAELEIYGKSDAERGIGAGPSSLDTGLRLRYEIRRELAPYVGITWNRKFLGTADFAEAAGEETSGARLALGVRVWF